MFDGLHDFGGVALNAAGNIVLLEIQASLKFTFAVGVTVGLLEIMDI